MTFCRSPSMPRLVRGVGLIEVLVAIVILAFGMLGIAAMQAAALRNTQSALERSQAVVQTYAMLERMRANRDSAMIGGYDLGAFQAPADPDDPPTGVVTDWTCSEPDPGSLIGNDQAAWIASLKDNFGDVDTTCGAIDCGSLSCVIAVKWDDARGSGGTSGDGDNETAQVLVTRTRL